MSSIDNKFTFSIADESVEDVFGPVDHHIENSIFFAEMYCNPNRHDDGFTYTHYPEAPEATVVESDDDDTEEDDDSEEDDDTRVEKKKVDKVQEWCPPLDEDPVYYHYNGLMVVIDLIEEGKYPRNMIVEDMTCLDTFLEDKKSNPSEYYNNIVKLYNFYIDLLEFYFD